MAKRSPASASPRKPRDRSTFDRAIAPKLPALRRALLTWYEQHGRELPWRSPRDRADPYRIWLSEIILQQTQVKTAIPYYQRLCDRFPTLESLAAASLQDVLKAWEGLGYYSRARNLHRAARLIVERHGGQFPDDFEAAIALPGIGRTTAGGILSHAFDRPIAILDGNVKRVLARLIALERPPAKAMKELWDVSEQLLDRDHPRDFNQALMDLGATLCTPHNPSCLVCPWMRSCQAYQTNRQADLPIGEVKDPLPHKTIGVAVIRNDAGQILIDRRPADGLLGGLWEFPGGKVEPNETIVDCVQREIQEEIGIRIEVGDELIAIDHAYSHYKVTLHVHWCRYLDGEPQAIACDEVKWVSVDDLDDYPFPKANGTIIEAIRAHTGDPSSQLNH